MSVSAYPLQWPAGRDRTTRRTNAAFHMSLGKARDHLLNEIRLLGGTLPVISSNLELRRDGLPYANQRNVDDPGAAVYFTYKGSQHCFACDQYFEPADNVRAIGKTIEALRGIARWGTGDMMERAFQGFAELPSPEIEPWWSVLGYYDEKSALAGDDFERAAREQMQAYHPDKPHGDEWLFKQIVKARAKGRELRGGQ